MSEFNKKPIIRHCKNCIYADQVKDSLQNVYCNVRYKKYYDYLRLRGLTCIYYKVVDEKKDLGGV